MAARAKTGLSPLAAIVAAAAVLCATSFGQTRMTLEQAQSRRQGDFAPSHLGERVILRGVVPIDPIAFIGYSHCAIQDAEYGFILEGTGSELTGLHAGYQVEASGVIGLRGGMAVLTKPEVQVIGKVPAPAAVVLRQDALRGFRHLGRLVEVDGRVVEVGDNGGGYYVLIGSGDDLYKFFTPRTASSQDAGYGALRSGDRIRASGIAAQYCATPPYNRWFQLDVPKTSDVVRLDRGWTVHPMILGAGLAGIFLLVLISWMRERKTRTHRELLRQTFDVGEEILGASSVDDILKRIEAVLPRIFRVTAVRLYVYNRGARTMELQSRSEQQAPGFLLDSPADVVQVGVATCFQHTTMLAVPDTSRAPFPVPQYNRQDDPKSLLFVPMVAQGEAVGVLELRSQRTVREFRANEQALAQHLANQTGAALRLLDQISMREQLFRTEKMAAVAQLVSGIVNELQGPLHSISHMTEGVAMRREASEHDLQAIVTEARRATGIVNRLVSFAGTDKPDVRPMDVNEIVRQLVEVRGREWKVRGIRFRNLIAETPLVVLGSEGRMQQVLLELLVHAEQILADAPEKLITIATQQVAKRALIEVIYPVPRGAASLEEDGSAFNMGLWRSVIAGLGGELRMQKSAKADARLQIDLPVVARRDGGTAAVSARPARASEPKTALLLEPEEVVNQRLLSLLSSRGWRVVPAASSEIAMDLAQRMRFDIALCSVHAPGLNWVELSEQLQPYVAAFVLLSDGYNYELAVDFEDAGRYVLPKPVEEEALDQILENIPARGPQTIGRSGLT